MARKFKPLTPQELEEIGRRRAEARELALRLLDEMSDEEDAAITAAAEADPDSPPLRDDAVLRPMHEVHPELVAERLRRGRPKLATPKRQVTLRLDADVIEGLRSTGPGWQTRVDDALRQWLRRTG